MLRVRTRVLVNATFPPDIKWKTSEQPCTSTQLGRVATLINDPDSASYGMAFRLKDKTANSALEYLNMRESKLGGYVTHTTMFYPRDDSTEPFSVVLFTATSENELWLGEAPLEEIADQVNGISEIRSQVGQPQNPSLDFRAIHPHMQ